MERRSELRLKDGARIAIIGGGPAGSFFAHFADKLARQQGIAVEITICDGKNFARQGPLGCNMCAGVISGPLIAQLERQGFSLPEERVQRRIAGYYLQTNAGGFALDHPDGTPNIRTVFRGNGPRFASPAGNISFDDFLLDHVKAQGITMVPWPVHDIIVPNDPRDRVVLEFADKGDRAALEADLVVGAFGLNTTLLEKVRALDFGYQPPRSRRVAQAELLLGREWITGRLQNRIVVFAIRVGSVHLGIMTPKAEHVTVTLLGKDDVAASDLPAFLTHPAVRDLLPPDWALPDGFCHCGPRFAVTAARRPFTDRLVLIGDASFSRYYKNGIESALLTAQLAAETAFQRGVSAAAFAEGYLKPANRQIVRDNRYGRLLFALPGLIAQSSSLAAAQQQILISPRAGTTRRALQRNLWDIFTGDRSYHSIFWNIASPRILARLAITALAIAARQALRRGPSARLPA